MNMRKIIAVVSAVLMLCAIIPMGAISVSAASNLVSNGTFDSSTSGWGKSTNTVLDISDGTLKATHADDWAYVYTSVSLTPNTDYVITFRAKADKGGFKINFNNASWASVASSVPSLEPAITTEWKDYELYFNSASHSKLLLFFQSNQYGSAAQTIWLDDVSVTVADTASFGTSDGYIYNGNFETGSSKPWTLGANASVVADPTGSNRGYVVKADEAGSGKSIVSQAATNLETDTDYVLSFKVYGYNTATNNAFWVQFPKSVTTWSVDVGSTGMTTQAANDYTPRINLLGKTGAWYDLSITFNTGALNAMYINFLNYRSDAGQYYFDDIKITPKDVPAAGEPIYSEDFEEGTLNGWSSSTSSIAAAADLPVANADGGSYAMKFVSTNYSYTNYTLAVEKNTTYRVQYSILSGEASRPLNIRIRTNGSVDLAYNQHAGSTTAWQTFTILFNSGNNTALNFRFQSGHSTCTYYIDNLSVTPVDVTQKDDGYIKNGDFESGMADNWDYTPSASYVENPDGLGYVLKTNETAKVNMLSQPVNIVEGKEYVLYFKVYGYSTASNSAIFVRLGAPANTTWDVNAIKHSMAGVGGDVSDTWTRQVRLNMNSNTGKWCYVAVPFTAAKTATINATIYNYRENEGKYYFDDFVVFEKKDASNDGYIINGDFETGTTEGVNLSGQTTVSPSAAKDGNFGLHLKNANGGWGGVGSWTINNLEVGATYKLEMDMKAISKGHNWTLWQDSTSSGVKYATGYFSATDWTHIEREFVAESAVAVLNINGGNGGVSEDVYLDNLKLTMTKPAHTCEFVGVETKAPTCTEAGEMTYSCTCGEGTYTEEIAALGHTYADDYDVNCDVCGEIRVTDYAVVTSFGGNSVSEDVSGLAFLFNVDAQVAIAFERITEIDYANSTIDGMNLVKMGAVLSNKGADTILDNLGDYVVDIPAVYAWNYTESSVSYAVRITEIPEGYGDRVITARPYVTYEADGVEITIYGEEQAASYNGILG